jgi:hypothetical protein
MFLYNTEHTGLSPYGGACGVSGSANWNYPTGNNSNYSSPAIDANGTSYFADYVLYAIKPTGGTLKWKFTFPTGYGDDYSSPAIGADGTIYVGATDGNLYAITPGGTEKWAFLTTSSDPVASSPAIGPDGTIYVGSDDGKLYAITDTGTSATEKWAFPSPTSGAFESSPAISADGSTVYVGSNDGNLYAVNAADGTQKWLSSAGADLYSSPAISANGETIYFSSYVHSVVYAISASAGTENWEFPLPDDYASFSSPAIGADGTIYIGSYFGNLYALTDNGSSATEKWAFPTGGDVNSSPAIGADGTIYIGSDDGNVYAITDNGPYCPSCSPPVTGTPPSEKWPHLVIGTAVDSSPAIGANTSIYFGAGNTLYALPPGPSTWPATSISKPASLSLGNSPAGDTVTKTITLTNTTGSNPMFLAGVSSTHPAEFSEVSTTCPSGGTGVATKGGTCTITIGFTPNQLGSRTATLTLLANGTICPQVVNVSGTGTVDMTVTPTSYAFGSVKVGSKKTKTITVHNYQTNPVSLSASPSGSNSGDFSVTGGSCRTPTSTPPWTLAKNTSCTLAVTYAPTAVGTEGATMTVTDSPDSLGPYTVSFTAAATIPEFLSTKKLNFGKVFQTASKTLSVTVTNNATGPITFTGPSIGGTNSGDFAISGTSTCSGPLAGGGGQCTYAVTFTPSTESAESGTLSIGVENVANGGPAAVTLVGTGVTPLKVTPASLAFGTVIAPKSKAKTVTVTNNGGEALTISASTGGGVFTVAPGASNGCPLSGSLGGGGSQCTYTVTFTPTGSGGPETGTLAVSDTSISDAASPYNVGLTGN